MTLKQFQSSGGKARAAKLSPERRSAIAKIAAARKWRNWRLKNKSK